MLIQLTLRHSPAVDVAGRRVTANQVIPGSARPDSAADPCGRWPDDLGIVRHAMPISGSADVREDSRLKIGTFGQPVPDHLLGPEHAASSHPQAFRLTRTAGLGRMLQAAEPRQHSSVGSRRRRELPVPLQWRQAKPRTLDIVRRKQARGKAWLGDGRCRQQQTGDGQEGEKAHAHAIGAGNANAG